MTTSRTRDRGVGRRLQIVDEDEVTETPVPVAVTALLPGWRCACQPDRPCLTHWAAMGDEERRRVAAEIGLTSHDWRRS